jgi:hypothetical protein
MPFIQSVMQEFVVSGGKQSYCTIIGVKKTKQHEIQSHHATNLANTKKENIRTEGNIAPR